MHPLPNDVVLATLSTLLEYQAVCIMKNAIIKKKKKKISLVVICDLVPMFSKTETDTLRSPPFKKLGLAGLLKFSRPISEPQCVCVKISDSDPP